MESQHVDNHEEPEEDEGIELCPRCLIEFHADLMEVHKSLHDTEDKFETDVKSATIGKQLTIVVICN